MLNGGSMTAKQLEKFTYREPFRPFRLNLANKERVSVVLPRKSLVSGPYIACAGITRIGRKITKKGLRIIHIDDVLSVDETNEKPQPI
jgi:hypothetical protein